MKSVIRILDHHWIGLIMVLFASAAPIPAVGSDAGSGKADSYAEYEAAKEIYPGFRVRSVEEFARMRGYRDSILTDGVTVHSFTMEDGSECQCIDVFSQGSLAAAGIAPEDVMFEPLMPPLPAPDRSASADASNSGLPDSEHVPPMLDGSLDPSGRIRRCPALSFPRRIPSEADLYRFATLEEFWAKYPGGGLETMIANRIPSPSRSESADGATVPAYSHKYAAGVRWEENIGQGGDFNLWCPEVENNNEFSLSQLWSSNGTDADLQSVELGWQAYGIKYGDDRARLFCFYTTNNYTALGDNQGCYNLDCLGFVQTSSDVVLGSTFPSYSRIDGTQYHVTLETFRDPPSGHWWLRYAGSIWIGYYPTSLFDSAGLKNVSERINMGGEMVDDGEGNVSTTDIGSGKFAQFQYGQAAYIKNMHFWTNDAYNQASGMEKIETHEDLYNVRLGSASDGEWNYYMFYGGPGAQTGDPQIDLYYSNHNEADCFAAGDRFDGYYWLQNPATAQLDVDLYIAMEFDTMYFFWPSWGEDLDHRFMMVPGKDSLSAPFISFDWPGNLGSLSGITFYGVMLRPNTFDLVGNVDVLPLCALGSGDLAFQLNWQFAGSGGGPDIDLHVVTPNGHHVYYGTRTSPDGGYLDFDDRGACGGTDGGGPENIYWENSTAPRGTYEYYVHWYQDCGSYASVTTTVLVRVNGSVVVTSPGNLTHGGTVNYSYTY